MGKVISATTSSKNRSRRNESAQRTAVQIEIPKLRIYIVWEFNEKSTSSNFSNNLTLMGRISEIMMNVIGSTPTDATNMTNESVAIGIHPSIE